MSEYDLIVRDGYVHTRDGIVDIGLRDGLIADIGDVSGGAEQTVEADGELVSPGLVDAHVHYDMAFSSETGRRPGSNEEPFDRARNMARTAEYFAESSAETVADRVRRAVGTAVANGVLHTRTHAYVDSSVGVEVVETVLDVRESLADLFDLQVVAFPQQGYVRDPGSVAAAREAVARGADAVGGIDPVGVNDDLEGTVETWLDLASDLDVDLDVHLHDRGTLGTHAVRKLATAAIERGRRGRVTVGHAYALADGNAVPGDPVGTALERASEADLSFVTCYMSTPPAFPLARIAEASPQLGHGTDQVRDLWSPHGSCDVLEGALVESLKLGRRSNPDLRGLWETVTAGSARVLGVEGYGVAEGTSGDLVVHAAASPERAIVRQHPPRCVISRGRVVARGGDLVGEAKARLGDAVPDGPG